MISFFFLWRKSSKCKLWRLSVYDSTSDCPKAYIEKVEITRIITRCDHTIMSMSMRQKNVLKFNMYNKLSFLIKWNCFGWAFYIFLCVWVRERFKGCCIMFCTFQTIIGGSCHKYNFCYHKSFVATNTSFVTTKACLSWQNFCRDMFILLRQTRVCRDKSMLVITKLLLQQICVCRNKSFVATKILCHDKHNFVLASILLSQEKTFVATKTCLSRQNATCGSSRQWYQTTYFIELLNTQ